MTVDNCILYLWPHFLSMDCRKSRSSLFSICNLAISCSYSDLLSNGYLRGRPFGFSAIPSTIFLLR